MERFGIGQAVRRVEDPRLLTGRGRFVEDLDLPCQCHGVVVFPPHAHALIRRVDTIRARSAAGVVCVLTGDDVLHDGLGPLPSRMQPEALGFPKSYKALRPILVRDRVRCVGDRVAVGLDRVEIRKRNFIAPQSLPYRTRTGLVYDSGDFRRVTERCLELADWNGFPVRSAVSAGSGRLRGRALLIRNCLQ